MTLTDSTSTTINRAGIRYGDPDFVLGATSPVIEHQLRHRSVRAFLPTPVTEEELRAIVAAASSASTSSNLQAWSVIAVTDPERKRRLSDLAARQKFIIEAPLFLVWVADLDRGHRLAERDSKPLGATVYLESTLLGVIDAALAAQNAVVALESLGLGSVFVGAVRDHPEEFAEELGLPPHSVAVFGLAVGHPDPTEDADVKPRLPQTAVLHRETYDAGRADADLPAYDERLAAYNRAHGLTGAWTERVLARLAGAAGLAGRERLRGILERRDLPSR
ncbi:NADPH-dependent oxidoreductase [Streptomyces malaysiensis subsp. malaysiensis]|uniref:NADPH-dependent oxidoreductase n=1 Tax=Streptomyces malaysiensis TaxID=92644 RepID=UPI0024C087CC|nr:NADPH-dependent oxidoreductase [Streptomyces sp. NA07423]WHX15734.1 NADPH-dependent oxidoreductase [Streptomyces sp. NA07423]